MPTINVLVTHFIRTRKIPMGIYFHSGVEYLVRGISLVLKKVGSSERVALFEKRRGFLNFIT